MLFVNNTSSEPESDSESEEFRPPAGTVTKMKVKQHMSLRSSPKKPLQKRSSPRKMYTQTTSTGDKILTSLTIPLMPRQSPRKPFLHDGLRPSAEEQQKQMRQSLPSSINLQEKSITFSTFDKRRQSEWVRGEDDKKPKPMWKPALKLVKKEQNVWTSEEEAIDWISDGGGFSTNKKSELFSTDEETHSEKESSDNDEEMEESEIKFEAQNTKRSPKFPIDILEAKPRKRGRKPKNALNEAYRLVQISKHLSLPEKLKSQSLRLTLDDYSNPFEAIIEEQQHQIMETYQRKMRDLIDINRYLGQPDSKGFSRRPFHRPFLLRNLHYMQKRNLSRNHNKITRFAQEHRTVSERTTSRASNKMPTTVKFKLIRNNNCFGHKSAIVQCFHASEIEGKLSQLKRIPSATFEKPINEKISTYIDIDMLEECQASNVGGKNTRSEYFVIRIVFQLEDAEVGGRHLRKVPSRQSDESKSLRKNGPAESKEVVMFGSVRIFSYSSDKGLQVAVGESCIVLYSGAELNIDDLNTKSSVGQVGRLINASKKSDGVPFVRIAIQNEEDEEEDEGKQQEEMKEEGERNSMGYRHLLFDRMMDELEETSTARKTINPALGQQLLHCGLLKLPEKIAIKFPLHPVNLSSSFLRSYQLNAQKSKSPDRGHMVKRHKFCFSDSSTEELMEEDSLDEESWLESKGIFHRTDEISTDQRCSHVLRVISPSTCFLCKAKLTLHNLSTLLRHLRFVHPRFDYIYEPNIPLPDGGTLPGFSLTLNCRFDASFELHSRKTHRNRVPKTNNNNQRKLPVSSRPFWLITKRLAQKMRENDEFPIDRFMALSNDHWGEYEYLLNRARFSFETPARVDQQWLLQCGSRKLEDITDLHPAERLMMQMWNAFLPRIRITIIGHKLTYKATRVFIRHHCTKIEQSKLQTHFLLLLSTLMNANAIDDEERYDLTMRLNPQYSPQEDSGHFVARELALLELMNRKGLGTGQSQSNLAIDKHKRNKRIGRQQQLVKKPKSTACGTSSKKQQIQPSHIFTPLPIQFKSLADLHSRYPFASVKRIENIWKFLRQYDFDDFPMISAMSAASNGGTLTNFVTIDKQLSEESTSGSSGYFSSSSRTKTSCSPPVLFPLTAKRLSRN